MLRRSLRASHVLQCLYVTWGEPILSCVNRYDVRMRKGNQMEYMDPITAEIPLRPDPETGEVR